MPSAVVGAAALPNVMHSIAALFFIAASFGHIYIGTLGMEGAYGGMRYGYVDEEWARQHHALWYDEVKRAEQMKPAEPKVPIERVPQA